MFDQTQIKQLLQTAEQAWYACLQILSHTTKHDQTCMNTIKHDQKAPSKVSPNGKMFGHQTFPVCPGPKGAQ